MRALTARVRSLWHGVRRGNALDAEMEEEFRTHIELRAADLQRSGLPAEEAIRRARVEFGGTYNYSQQGREQRGLRWFDALHFSWLDVRLGARMLRKYPGLTLVSSLAMGVAIAVAAGGSTIASILTEPNLPLPEGNRVVGIQLWDTERWYPDRRILHDVADWRRLRTIQDVGAFRPVVRNLVNDLGHAEMIRAAEMNASGFRTARVRPLLGRYLVDEDERPGAPSVAVIGHHVWRSRFGADSGIVGRRMRFGANEYTIVGVMPEGFAFPVSYEMWVPPTVSAEQYPKRREGPALFAFGRLAPGVTLDDARAELATIDAAIAKTHPETNRAVRARVLQFAPSWWEMDSPEVRAIIAAARLIMLLLLLVISVNVAILVYARTATRQGEIAVRSALGASRTRIVSQLFGEALVLAALGAAVGLLILSGIAARIDQIFAALSIAAMPFWMKFEVSDTTIGYLVALAVASAVVIGVIPALQLTGRRVQLRLQRLAGGHSTLSMGRAWTALITIEVALTVAILPAAVRFAGDWITTTMRGPGFPAEQYVSAMVYLERPEQASLVTPEESSAFLARFGKARAELMRRLEKDPEVLQATYTNGIPGNEGGSRFEIDSLTLADTSRLKDGLPRRALYPSVRSASVDMSFFRTLDIPLLAGRDFAISDSGASVAIVNRQFVDSLLSGRNAIGRRIRAVSFERDQVRPFPWQEIIGVVENFPANMAFDSPRAAIYDLGAGGRIYPATVVLRTRGDPAAFGPRLRAIALEVEPAFLVHNVGPLDAVIQATHLPLQWLALSLGVVTLSVLLLSAAGVYALMSVIVTQRRREIGIRVALGADHWRVLSSIFSRAAAQLGAGVAVGIGLAILVNGGIEGSLLGPKSTVILAAVTVFMLGVGALAALQPARQGLRIQPTEALKAE